MTTPTNSHKAWTDKGGHVNIKYLNPIGQESKPVKPGV